MHVNLPLPAGKREIGVSEELALAKPQRDKEILRERGYLNDWQPVKNERQAAQ